MFCYTLFLMMKITYSCLTLHPAINDRYGKVLNRKIIVKESSEFYEPNEPKYKLSLHVCSVFAQIICFMEILWKTKSFTVSPIVLQRIVKAYIP